MTAPTGSAELCLRLMRADTEDEVVQLLRSAGYWDEPSFWRYFGDAESNYSGIGNQQSEAVAALVEKIVNSVDARLMNACWETGIDPASESAPRSIREAVGRFFEPDTASSSERAGRISNWNPTKVTAEARLITMSATGHMPAEGQPSISIADQGEGQAPEAFPETFLSLDRRNKFFVHFVQGKFNMGGTGALQFCSARHRLQLIVSRRNPKLVSPNADARAHDWGFTIVRRESPPTGGRSSVFTYLAPVEVDVQRRGGVLSFPADEWPIFPEADGRIRDAYVRMAPFGSLVKLYEYEWQGVKSNIVSSGGGLLRRIDAGLPELALPVRVFECRPGYRGHAGSFATNAMGLAARLEQDRAENLEAGYPIASVVHFDDRQVRVRVFAFKKGKAVNYRAPRQAVMFSVNGQAHASLSMDFFRRKDVGMSYLADSLLVLVDCSDLDGRTREDLFMNSRDRLRNNELSDRVESEIGAFLRDDATLRALRNRRREEELSETLGESRPLADVLQDLMRHSPALSKLLLRGLNLSSPFPQAGSERGSSSNFTGKTYPTFFRFKGLDDAATLSRDAHIGSRVRIGLETDAADDYFVRDLDTGSARLQLIQGASLKTLGTWSVRGPVSGVASLSLDLPDSVRPGERLGYILEITDPSRVDSFLLPFNLRVQRTVPSRPGSEGQRTVATHGSGSRGGQTRLALPNIVPIQEKDWATQTPPFDESTACVVKHAGQDLETGAHSYDFFINVDNKFLRLAQKESSEEPRVLRARFVYGLVLIGLALLQEYREESDSEDKETVDSRDVERDIRVTSRAIAPVLLPMLETIGSLAAEY